MSSIANIAYRSTASRFDWLMAILGWWLVGGLILDIWAHGHNYVDNSFFTVWHWLFYSGFGVVTITLAIVIVQKRIAGAAWRNAVPIGYGLAVIGVPLFMISGIGDYLWHSTYGFDLASDAPISPTHLGIVLAIGMIVSGGFRSAQDFTVPAGLSALALITVCTLTIQFMHPTARVWADPDVASRFLVDPTLVQSLALGGMVVLTFLWVGFMIILATKWTLPKGSFVCLLSLNGLMMVTAYDQYRLMPAAFLAGLWVEGIIWYAIKRNISSQQLIGVGLPLIYYSTYFLILYFSQRLWWQPHVWMGAIVLCSLTGWLLGSVMQDIKRA